MMMKKILFTFAFLLVSIASSAYDAKIDGIYYNLIPKGKAAMVVGGDEKYRDEISIPSTVVYEGETYKVESVSPWAFRECTNLTKVTLSNGIKE